MPAGDRRYASRRGESVSPLRVLPVSRCVVLRAMSRLPHICASLRKAPGARPAASAVRTSRVDEPCGWRPGPRSRVRVGGRGACGDSRGCWRVARGACRSGWLERLEAACRSAAGRLTTSIVTGVRLASGLVKSRPATRVRPRLRRPLTSPPRGIARPRVAGDCSRRSSADGSPREGSFGERMARRVSVGT